MAAKAISIALSMNLSYVVEIEDSARCVLGNARVAIHKLVMSNALVIGDGGKFMMLHNANLTTTVILT
jgi:hypothetical protein